MSSIWQNEAGTWRLVAPSGFPKEADLHDLVERAPQVLPLSGSPNLVVLGREVLLGGNYADLIAIEPTGRLVVVEIKLANNAEARRAVIAQILTYAAFLRGLSVEQVERDVLGKHLAHRRFSGLAAAIQGSDQEGAFDPTAFEAGLHDSLAQGSFRLVLVLDEAPAELVRLVGYLEAVADRLVIDLVTVSSYAIGGSQVIVPQRIQPEHQTSSSAKPVSTGGRFVEGVEDFETAIASSPPDQQPTLRSLTEWAKALEEEGLVRLGTYHGTRDRLSLLPRLKDDGVGLVTVWNEHGAWLQFWRSVFLRRAPQALARIEQLMAPAQVGQGTSTRAIAPELLAALTDAYREAATGRVVISPGSFAPQA